MGNILDKGTRLQKKQHAIRFKITGLKGAKAYLLRRDGTAKPFTILAVFDAWIMDEDNFRVSLTFRFAAGRTEAFRPFATSRTMRQIADVATDIAVVESDGSSTVYQIRKGDEWTVMFLDWEWKFYATLTKNTFVVEDNIDAQ